MDSAQSGSLKRVGGNFIANLRAIGVSGVAFLITVLLVVSYWDRLIWPLMVPTYFACLSWFLLRALRIPAKIAPAHVGEAERFERLSRQALVVFWCCWQWGFLIYVAQANFRFTGRMTGNRGIFEAAMNEFMLATSAMHPVVWVGLAVLFCLFAYFLLARRRTISKGLEELRFSKQ